MSEEHPTTTTNPSPLVPEPPDLAARMLLFGALNWSVEWYDPRRGTIDAFVREAAEIFLNGISSTPPIGPPAGRSAPRERLGRDGRAANSAARAAPARLTGRRPEDSAGRGR